MQYYWHCKVDYLKRQHTALSLDAHRSWMVTSSLRKRWWTCNNFISNSEQAQVVQLHLCITQCRQTSYSFCCQLKWAGWERMGERNMEPYCCCGTLCSFFKIQYWVFTLTQCSRGHHMLLRNPISVWSVAMSFLMMRQSV